jgi:hypothetical protein
MAFLRRDGGPHGKLERMETPFSFATDTSTLVVFDLAMLRHRLDDDAPDWWVFPHAVQVDAVNTGAAAFIDLGGDGTYTGTLSDDAGADAALSFVLSCPSGQVFLGAGEETTADGMEPDCTRGGLMLRFTPGTYRFTVAVAAPRELRVDCAAFEGPARNAFDAPLRLDGSGA